MTDIYPDIVLSPKSNFINVPLTITLVFFRNRFRVVDSVYKQVCDE